MKIITVRNKSTGEVRELPHGAYEVRDAFVIPLQCLYKTSYELVDKEKKTKNNT